nr:Hypothetical protein CBG17640 [Haemonchus contortus]
MGLCTSKSRYTTDLSVEEIEAIREVWIKAKNNNVGKKILQTLIEKRPKFAEYFGIQSESLDIKALNQSKEFHLQAHRIQNFLDTAVGSLGYCPISRVNFGADNWLVFKRVAVDQVTTGFSDTTSDPGLNGMTKPEEEMMNLYSNENCLARLGWNKLMTVIVREMKRGFLEEAMRNCKEEDNKDIFKG